MVLFVCLFQLANLPVHLPVHGLSSSECQSCAAPRLKRTTRAVSTTALRWRSAAALAELPSLSRNALLTDVNTWSVEISTVASLPITLRAASPSVARSCCPCLEPHSQCFCSVNWLTSPWGCISSEAPKIVEAPRIRGEVVQNVRRPCDGTIQMARVHLSRRPLRSRPLLLQMPERRMRSED